MILPLSGELAAGERRVLVAHPSAAFRPHRLVISSASFYVPMWLRALMWLPMLLGRALGRGQRALERVFDVDTLRLPRMRLEPMSDADADSYIGELAYDDNDAPCRVVELPMSPTERVLRALGGMARRLAWLRTRWQERQLGSLVIYGMRSGGRQQMTAGTPVTADFFAPGAYDTNLSLDTCSDTGGLELDIENRGRRPCNLYASFVGEQRG
jgi:hypothetical protein